MTENQLCGIRQTSLQEDKHTKCFDRRAVGNNVA